MQNKFYFGKRQFISIIFRLSQIRDEPVLLTIPCIEIKNKKNEGSSSAHSNTEGINLITK